MSSLQHRESSQRTKAIISTAVLHALLFVVCYFFYIHVQIPIEEIETGGVVINYGTSETGMGTNYTSTDEPAIGENITNEPIEDPNRPNLLLVQAQVLTRMCLHKIMKMLLW